MDFTPTAFPTPAELTPADVAALWAHVKEWFTEPRPGRSTRLKTLSLTLIQSALNMNSVALYRYLAGKEYRGKPAGPPAACHLGPLVSLLRADYGLLLPGNYAVFFHAADTLL